MSELPVVVLDPGHGGPQGSQNRGSSWNRARGPNGLLEKDVAFDLALRVAARLRNHARVELTRSEESNPSLGERADVARRSNAAVFLSLHLNGSHNPNDDGTDVYVAPEARQASRALGESVLRNLVGVTGARRHGLSARDLGMLHTKRHAPRTAAVLAEIAHLTNERQAQALEREDYRNSIADALSDAIRQHLAAPAESMAEALDLGDGGPDTARAVADCWKRCEQHRDNHTIPTAAQNILSETGVRVGGNPYSTITQSEVEAVVRAAYHSGVAPEILLALWQKKGLTTSVTVPFTIGQATTDANAKSIFRSGVFAKDLGLDHFVVTYHNRDARAEVWDDRDESASRQEARFTQGVRDLVTSRHLSQDIAGAINRELTVTRTGSGPRSVQPSTRFYALCLILAGARWRQLQSSSFPQVPAITDGLNYLQWNEGNSFATFLRTADAFRNEPRNYRGGLPVPLLEEWLLHTPPKASELGPARTAGIEFLYFLECYRPLFAPAQPQPATTRPPQQPVTRPHEIEIEEQSAIAEQLAAPIFIPNINVIDIPAEPPIDFDLKFDIATAGAAHAFTFGIATVRTRAELLARLGPFRFQETAPGSNIFDRFPQGAALDLVPFFNVTNPAQIRIVLRSVMAYPADPANRDRVLGTDRLPVVVIVHGNHQAVNFASTPAGAPIVTGSGQTIRPANPTGATAIDSFRGYSTRTAPNNIEYLQEELAHRGFISMSIDHNPANYVGGNFTMRAELIFKYLEQLDRMNSTPGNRFFNRLDLSKIGLVGHSRGGEAVVAAAKLNSSRTGRRFGIRSVVSLAPTDLSSEMAVTATQRPLRMTMCDGFYCVVLGSHDGDVGSGEGSDGSFVGNGFGLYNRAASHRAMVFIHGATHNRFNRVWNNFPGDGDPSHNASDGRIRTRREHEQLAIQYIGGWLRYTMNQDFAQQNNFLGVTAPVVNTPVSLQWKFGTDLRTVEDSEAGPDTINTMFGTVTPAPAANVRELAVHGENDADAEVAAVAGAPAMQRPTFPGNETLLRATNVTAGGRATVREEVPAFFQDVSAFTDLTFRITKKYPITAPAATLATAAFPDIEVTLINNAGVRRTVNNATILAQNPRRQRPYQRIESTPITVGATVTNVMRNITHCPLETWRIPLRLFTTGGFTLNQIRAVELSFNAVASQPIYVDTITFVRL